MYHQYHDQQQALPRKPPIPHNQQSHTQQTVLSESKSNNEASPDDKESITSSVLSLSKADVEQ